MALVLTAKPEEPFFIECAGKLLVIKVQRHVHPNGMASVRVLFEDPSRSFTVHRKIEHINTSLEEAQHEKTRKLY